MDEHKTYWQYTQLLWKRVLARWWKALGSWVTALSFAASVGASLLINRPESFSDLGGNEAVMAALFFVGIYVIVLVAYLLKEPVTIYNEQAAKTDELTAKLEAIEKARPNIRVRGRPYRDPRNLWDKSGEFTIKACFHIKFANYPQMHTAEATARKVVAQLAYYNRSGQRLVGPHYARWSDRPQPTEGHLLTELRYPIDLSANGLPNEITLAWWAPQEQVIYAFSDKSYEDSDWKIPEYAIRENEVYICVRLTGENVEPVDFWVLLRCTQESQAVQMTEPLTIGEE